MYKQSSVSITTLSLALTLSLGFATEEAGATKLNAAPLPHERQSKDFNTADGETIISHPSRFQRRPDYREVEAQKQKDAEEAAKKAEDARFAAAEERKRAQTEAIDNYKKRQELAIDANNKAVAFGKQGRWLDAISAHERAVQLDPANKQFQINLSAARVEYGKSKLAAGDLTAASGLFRKSLAAAPDNGLAGKLLAQTMGKQGRDPMSADVRLATGDQLAAIGDLEGAAIEYQAAMQLEPTARCYTKMGDMALRFGQLGTATNWYRQSIVKDPDYGPAHRQLGLLALTQKDYTGAAASLRKAIILDCHDTAAGQALIEIWRRQVAANPLLAENHLGLAGALQLAGDYIGADSEYRRLEVLDSKNPGLESGRASLARAFQHDKAEKHKLAAETLFNQGLRREALAEISQSVMIEPRNAKYQFLLGECLEANGDFQGAHQAYLTCVLIDPENNQEAAARMKQMQNGVNRNGGNNGVSAPRSMQPPVTAGMQSPYNAGAQPNIAMPRKDMFECGPTADQPVTSAAQSEGSSSARNEQNIKTAAGRGRSQDLGRWQRTTTRSEETSGDVEATGEAGASRGAPTGSNNQGARTRFATTRSAVSQSSAPVQTAPSPMEAELKEADARVSEAESRRDYAAAVEILKQLVVTHVQNPNVHHRLAVNLLNSGDINEAVSEFRIASALNPSKKEFSDDLAQAMIIHKRALTSEADSRGSADGSRAVPTGSCPDAVNAGANK